MRQGTALLTGLLFGLLAGCFTPEPMRTVTFKERFHSLDYVNTANMVQMEVRLIETRLGDGYINKDLWTSSLDEQVVSFEKRVILNKNGIRVAQVAGAIPSRLQELMTLERCCINPRRLLLPAGKPNTINLGPVVPLCQYQVEYQGHAAPIELIQAQCSLKVTPTLNEDGTIQLHFTPQVEHGKEIFDYLPTRDRSGLNWVMEVRRPTQLHPELSWDITLVPNAFLVIGCMLDYPDSLGCQALSDHQSGWPVQRLLVLRASGGAGSGIDAEIAPRPAVTTHRMQAPPLALQATDPTTRAYRP